VSLRTRERPPLVCFRGPPESKGKPYQGGKQQHLDEGDRQELLWRHGYSRESSFATGCHETGLNPENDHDRCQPDSCGAQGAMGCPVSRRDEGTLSNLQDEPQAERQTVDVQNQLVSR